MNNLPTTIKVTLDHILSGIPDDCAKCPVALAIAEEYQRSLSNYATVHVFNERTEIVRGIPNPQTNYEHSDTYKHSSGLEYWIREFDLSALNIPELSPKDETPGTITLILNHETKTISTKELELHERT